VSSIELTWAGGEHTFALRMEHLRALQTACDAGPQFILSRLRTGTWLVDDVLATIRLGLEGGGLTKQEARALVTKHVEDRPITLSVIAAQMVLMASLYGTGDDDPVGEAQGEAEETDSPTSPMESGDSPSSTEPESSLG
jgi:hypothetical protein